MKTECSSIEKVGDLAEKTCPAIASKQKISNEMELTKLLDLAKQDPVVWLSPAQRSALKLAFSEIPLEQRYPGFAAKLQSKKDRFERRALKRELEPKYKARLFEEQLVLRGEHYRVTFPARLEFNFADDPKSQAWKLSAELNSKGQEEWSPFLIERVFSRFDSEGNGIMVFPMSEEHAGKISKKIREIKFVNIEFIGFWPLEIQLCKTSRPSLPTPENISTWLKGCSPWFYKHSQSTNFKKIMETSWSEPDCKAICKTNYGSTKCTLSGHDCVSTSHDCKKTCRIHGDCETRSGICVATSARDCKKSYTCKKYGNCYPIGWRCLARSEADCKIQYPYGKYSKNQKPAPKFDLGKCN